MTRYENITTHDIRVGDRIRSYGMTLLVDREPKQTFHPVDNAGGITLATKAIIENFDELVQEASEFDNGTAAFIVSRVRNDRFHAKSMGKEPDTEPRWTIQGNGWARWSRITEA